MDIRKAYENKKVFITGITGFKGSWLALLLNKLGADVYGLGLENPRKDTVFYQSKVGNIAKVYIQDLRDEFPDEIINHIQTSDYIFHFGAQAIVSVGYKDPLATFDANLMGTVKLLELVKNSEKEITLLSVASDRVYKSVEHAHLETDPLGGYDPYSLSKVFTNQVVDMYRQMDGVSKNIRLINARASNVLGPGDKGEARIMTTILDALPDGVIELRNPTFVRPYIYVLDCLCQYLMIAHKGTHEAYNIGAGKETSVQVIELVESCRKLVPTLQVATTGKKFGFEGNTLLVNTDRFHNEFDVDYAITNTIDDITSRVFMYERAREKEQITDLLLDEAIKTYQREV